MASIRTRLTVGYTAALLGALVAFGVALWFARRASAYQELGHLALVQADQALDVLRDAQLSGDSLVVVTRDSQRGTTVQPTPRLRERLDRFGGYFVVLDARDRLLFASYAVRHLSDEGQADLLRVAVDLRSGGEAAIIPMPADSDVVGNRMLAVADGDSTLGPGISRVVAAMPTHYAEVAPELLVGTMLVIAPLILVLSIAIAFYMAGSAFRPVDRLITELEAITDGRSLHRRLPTDPSNDELSRLAATLNAMIARLEHSFGALRRFTADASHELKTPLTVLRADVERAMNPSSGNERLVALEEALQEIRRMSDLVESLLTLARADEGRFDLHREPLHLEPLVRDVFETAGILGESVDLTVRLPVLEDAVVLGDAQRLRQLFLNLITNAIKYTPRGGEVDISLVRRGEHEAAFSVRDTGVGISAVDLPHIFDRFWRADRARSRASERAGSGLGLAISQWIAQAHGGTLTVQSRLGRGSLFTVVLPTASDGEGRKARTTKMNEE